MRTSAASSGPPRASEEFLRRSRARGGLLGELVQVEAFFANPQVEVEQDDGDIRDGSHHGAHQGPDDLDDCCPKIASADEGCDNADQDDETIADDPLHDTD